MKKVSSSQASVSTNSCNEFSITFACEYLVNIDGTQIYRYSNKVKIIQELCKHVAILKPDKGNGIVLTDIKVYTFSVEHLFKDTKKFRILDTDPTIRQMKFLQSYLRTLLKFRPIIDTTITRHCLVGKCLASLLYLLTTNKFSLKDSFDAANRVKAIPSYIFENGYQYVSSDLESLFTNVPINRTVVIILRQIYQDCNFNKFENTDFEKTYVVSSNDK